MAIFWPIFPIWPSKSDLLGQIYCTFPMGKLLIVYCNVPALRNGQPISNCYFKLCMHTYTNRKCFINTCIEVQHMIRIRELGEQHWKSKLFVKLSKGEIYFLFCWDKQMMLARKRGISSIARTVYMYGLD